MQQDLTIHPLSNPFQIVIDGHIFLQTMPVETELAQILESEGRLQVPHCPFYECLVIRHGRLQGSGSSAGLNPERQCLISGRPNSRAFSSEVIKVNHDGPSLQVRQHYIAPPHVILSSRSRSTLTLLETRMMHERILLLFPRNKNRKILLNILGEITYRKWVHQGIENLNQAIAAHRDAVREDPDDAGSLQLGDKSATNSVDAARPSLLRRFERLGSLSAFGDSDHLTPSGHPDKLEILTRLGIALMSRFERLGDLGDLAKSVLDGHPNRPLLLEQLGTSLLSHLNSSVSLLEEALHLTPHGHLNRCSKQANLDRALHIRFERLGDLADLHRSVFLGSEAASALNNHGLSLLTRFERLGNLDDLNRSIEMYGHPDTQLRLQNLGSSLSRRFLRFGHVDDLNQSISICQNAPARLQNLGHSLRLRFERFGDIEDLQRSAVVQEESIRLTPEQHPDKLDRLSALHHSILLRFQWLGDLADINYCIILAENILELTPDALGTALKSRFEHIGDLGDLNRSVVQHYKALHLMPEDHCIKPSYLMSLGQALGQRFEQLAILLFEDAVRLTPDGDINKPVWLNNLGLALRDLFKRLGDPNDLKKSVQMAENAKPVIFKRFHNIDDLNRSISTEEESLRLTPDNHPERQAWLNNLAMCLLSRFQKLENAIRETPDGHPDRPAWLTNHSVSLQSRPGKNPEDLEEVINRLSSAAHSMTGPAHIRFYAPARWARLAQIEAHPSVLDAYEYRHYHIKCGTAAIAAGLPGVAVEWLERGRAIIWGQLLNLRTPVDDLRKRHPVLAEKFIFLSAQLEGTGIRGGETNVTNSSTQALTAQRSHDQALERNTLLEDIRRLEGFDGFLLPKAMSELSKAAQGGPVVILNLSDDRCDVLVLSSGAPDVIHIFLPEFTPEHAENLSRSLHGLVHNRGRNERLIGHREGHLDPEEVFARILSELWTRLVKPVLNALNITTPRTHNFQRIWWCPTGPLTFLPIHAAGIYGANEIFGSKLSDFVISSYTPSLAALIQGFRPRSQSQKSFRVLAVAQPSAQGQTYIPGTQAEITSIQRHATGKVSVLRLDANMATVDNVQAGMRDSRWVHFACHGVQNASDPTESALLLAGSSKMTLSSIIKLSLPEADFAFLSACQTATGDEVLQEEAVHLAGGILAAGYRGVIATMWTIMDSDAPQVASDVYEHLFQDSLPDSGRAAEALHFAIKRLREGSENRKSFSHWVPFIHVGV
ncbi:CHAT domain-containing protein [Mycena leptocephala]|nr:CHAT domain-containing protein [Mycena leptocephala]